MEKLDKTSVWDVALEEAPDWAAMKAKVLARVAQEDVVVAKERTVAVRRRGAWRIWVMAAVALALVVGVLWLVRWPVVGPTVGPAVSTEESGVDGSETTEALRPEDVLYEDEDVRVWAVPLERNPTTYVEIDFDERKDMDDISGYELTAEVKLLRKQEVKIEPLRGGNDQYGSLHEFAIQKVYGDANTYRVGDVIRVLGSESSYEVCPYYVVPLVGMDYVISFREPSPSPYQMDRYVDLLYASQVQLVFPVNADGARVGVSSYLENVVPFRGQTSRERPVFDRVMEELVAGTKFDPKARASEVLYEDSEVVVYSLPRVLSARRSIQMDFDPREAWSEIHEDALVAEVEVVSKQDALAVPVEGGSPKDLGIHELKILKVYGEEGDYAVGDVIRVLSHESSYVEWTSFVDPEVGRRYVVALDRPYESPFAMERYSDLMYADQATLVFAVAGGEVEVNPYLVDEAPFGGRTMMERAEFDKVMEARLAE